MYEILLIKTKLDYEESINRCQCSDQRIDLPTSHVHTISTKFSPSPSVCMSEFKSNSINQAGHISLQILVNYLTFSLSPSLFSTSCTKNTIQEIKSVTFSWPPGLRIRWHLWDYIFLLFLQSANKLFLDPQSLFPSRCKPFDFVTGISCVSVDRVNFFARGWWRKG